MKKKLTPWFDGSVKPVRVGVYERDDSGTACSDGKAAYSYWNGKYWNCLDVSIKLAAKYGGPDSFSSGYQNLPWRGLAVKPERESA